MAFSTSASVVGAAVDCGRASAARRSRFGASARIAMQAARACAASSRFSASLPSSEPADGRRAGAIESMCASSAPSGGARVARAGVGGAFVSAIWFSTMLGMKS